MSTMRYGFAPFYTDARRMLRLSGPKVDQYLSWRAVASIDGGDVTFLVPDGRVFHEKVRILGRRRAAQWVNQFNERPETAR
jgi:hypothetical protein